MKQELVWMFINSLIRWRFPHVRHLTVKELHQELQQSGKKPPLLLDGRTSSEYEVSHLHQAYLISDSLEQLEERFGLDKNSPIVVYCSIGYRSALVAHRLQQIGYAQVFNLNGSLFQWATEGYGVYQGQQVVQQIHPYNRWWQWGLSLMLPTYQFCQKAEQSWD